MAHQLLTSFNASPLCVQEAARSDYEKPLHGLWRAAACVGAYVGAIRSSDLPIRKHSKASGAPWRLRKLNYPSKNDRTGKRVGNRIQRSCNSSRD